jgi:hypothetical protein
MKHVCHRIFASTLGALAAVCLTAGSPAHAGGAAPRVMSGEQLYAQAAKQFRDGRFPGAYGRFVALADAGHAPSARLALLMCEQGPTLFGSDWDCAPHQVQDWAEAAGVAAPATVNRIHGAPAAVRATTPSQGARR